MGGWTWLGSPLPRCGALRRQAVHLGARLRANGTPASPASLTWLACATALETAVRLLQTGGSSVTSELFRIKLALSLKPASVRFLAPSFFMMFWM